MAASSLTVMVQLQDQVTAPARQATKAVDNFTNSVQRSARGANQLGANMGKATRDTRKFAMTGMQQAGYQVGDFAVQVSGGTSALQAFGQQGSQLLGIFGPFGAVLGAVVAIVAAFGNAFMKSRDQAKSFSEEIDELSETFTELDTLTKGIITDTAKLGKTYFDVTKEVRRLHKAQIEMASFKLKEALNQSVTALESEFDAFGRVRRAQEKYNEKKEQGAQKLMMYQRALNNAKTRMFELGEQMGLNRDETQALSETFAALSEADPFQNPIESAKLLQSLYDQITSKGLKELSNEAIASAEGILKFQEVLREFAAKTSEAIEEQVNLFGLVKDEVNILSEGISKSFGDAVFSIIKGTQSTKEAFKSMAASIIDQLLQVLVIQQLVGGVGTGGKGSGGTGLAGFLSGTRATGGPVTAGQTYLVGERGPELFTSGTSGRVIPNNQMQGGATVVQNINISTGVSQTVRAEISQLMPQIAEASKAAVLDAKKRGGSFSRSF